MVANTVPLQLAQWRQALAQQEGLDGVVLDETILADDVMSGSNPQPLNLHIPSFKNVVTEDYNSCAHSPWPAMSISGGSCKLMCDHCQAGILKPMLDVSTPERLWDTVQQQIARGARGMLLSGGSNHRNELDFAPFYNTIARIKASWPEFKIAVHTGLSTPQQARTLREVGIDVAMLDIIGAQETITQVYHLKRSVADFGASMAALLEAGLTVVPHIVMGLHYGEFLGESRALEMIAGLPISALVLVAAMPQYAKPSRPFKNPDVHHIGRFLFQARQRLARTPIYLGCARPAGLARSQIDTYAVLAGLNGIAHPAEGILGLARSLGREPRVLASCCSIGALSELEMLYEPAATANTVAGVTVRVEGAAG